MPKSHTKKNFNRFYSHSVSPVCVLFRWLSKFRHTIHSNRFNQFELRKKNLNVLLVIANFYLYSSNYVLYIHRSNYFENVKCTSFLYAKCTAPYLTKWMCLLQWHFEIAPCSIDSGCSELTLTAKFEIKVFVKRVCFVMLFVRNVWNSNTSRSCWMSKIRKLSGFHILDLLECLLNRADLEFLINWIVDGFFLAN